MTVKEELIDNYEKSIRSSEALLLRKDWASSGSEYHLEVRKRLREEINLKKRIIKFLNK